jgi:chaperonin GroES
MSPPDPGAAAPPIQSIASLMGGTALPSVLQGFSADAEPPLPSFVPEEAREHYRMLERWQRSANIAEEDDAPDDLDTLTMRVGQDYEIDERSRVEWREKYRKWLDFAQQVVEEKQYPWPKASNVIYPLLTTASLQFAARAYPAIIRDSAVVKGKVIGDDSGTPTLGSDGKPIILPATQQPLWKIAPGAKQTRADLIGRHMSWQLLDEQEEWEPQTDRLLVVLPIVGTMFRKSYFDPALGRNVSETVDAIDLCVNYKAKSFETAPRQTEMVRLYPWEIEERIRAGLFCDKEYGHDSNATRNEVDNGPPPDQDDDDAAVTFLEQHRRWDLDGDGYAEPYIVTVSRDTHRLARIRAGFDMEGILWGKDGRIIRAEKVQYYTKYGFIPSPDSVVYDLGFGHLLYPLNEAINTSLNQMFDAGHLQNVGGGFIGSGLSVNAGAMRFAMGEYKPVNAVGGALRDNIYTMEFKGPSQVLLMLLQFLVEAAERVAAVKDVMVGDMPGDNTSGITTLAVIEQGLKVFSAIYKRIYRSLGYEFRKLYRLNRLYLADQQGFGGGDGWEEVKREDYEFGSGVEPISDPQMVTDMQRLGRAQFLLTFKDDPACNGMAIRQEAFTAAMIAQPQRFLVPNPQPPAQVQLKSRELDIREKREMTDLQLRSTHDRAMMIREVAQAELFLAQARKLDNDAQLGWVEQHINRLKVEVDALGTLGDIQNQAADNGGGDGGGAASDPGTQS